MSRHNFNEERGIQNPSFQSNEELSYPTVIANSSTVNETNNKHPEHLTNSWTDFLTNLPDESETKLPSNLRVTGKDDSYIKSNNPELYNIQLSDSDAKATEPAADDEEAEDESDRDKWSSPIEFLLSCISMSVGLGNVWRFPYIAYKNGGGAFLIPYLIVLLFIGKPMYFLEMCLGQFSSYGQVKVWNLAPIMKGIGYASMMGTICLVSYYCALMALTVFYFASSFAKELPWKVCRPEWGEEWCNSTGSYIGPKNSSSTAQLFYDKEVYPQKERIDDGLGAPEWRLTLCLLFAWLAIFLSLFKGVKSSGKVAYFTSIFPYVVMLIFLVRGATLDGAGDGILYFITPQWDKIGKPEVWFAAVGQCFFSLSTAFGPIIMFSSYNSFRHNVYRDALIISVMDTITSLLGGVIIFAVLGNLAHILEVDVSVVAKGGPGLAFVSYADAISKFEWVPQLFAVLFFFMLFTLGVGSATSLVGGVITIICDQFPQFKRWQVTSVVTVVGFCSGLMYVTPGGSFMMDLVDHFGANFLIYVIAMIEVTAISYLYGLNNFCSDIEFMLNFKVGWYWKFCWGFFIPIGLFGILVYWIVTNEELTLEGVSYPTVAIVCGWLLAGFSLLLIPIWACQAIYTRKAHTFKGKFLESLRPTIHWGPKNPKLRKQWVEFKQQNPTTEWWQKGFSRKAN